MGQVRFRIVSTTLLLLLSGASAAAEGRHLELAMTVEKEVAAATDSGAPEVVRVRPELVLPGEEVIYTISYRNVGADPATDVAITNAIPEHMVYTSGSALGDGMRVLFSLDGDAFSPPSLLFVPLPEGGERPAEATDYTHIRWVLEPALAPGGEGEVSYRARLE